MRWLRKQYDDIKGNLKWALLGPLWVTISWAANRLLHMIPNMPAWAVWAIVLVASSLIFVWVAKNRDGNPRAANTAQTATNALMGSPAAIGKFDATMYFEQSYVSPLQPEAENNIRAAAAQNQPNDREGFYVRLIVVGVIAYVYDMAWAYIFRSQIHLLIELNRRLLLLAEAKTFYDKAATDSPTMYANYSFDQWMDFMKSNLLLIQHPSGMVEITIRGRDFLKYLVHWGRSADDRKF